MSHLKICILSKPSPSVIVLMVNGILGVQLFVLELKKK